MSQASLLRLHYDREERVYGDVCSVNLVDGAGEQGRLGSMFGEVFGAVKTLGGVRGGLLWWDFHKECEKGYDRIGMLVEELASTCASE